MKNKKTKTKNMHGSYHPYLSHRALNTLVQGRKIDALSKFCEARIRQIIRIWWTAKISCMPAQTLTVQKGPTTWTWRSHFSKARTRSDALHAHLILPVILLIFFFSHSQTSSALRRLLAVSDLACSHRSPHGQSHHLDLARIAC